MPAPELPPFEPVTLDELRRIWSSNKDPDVRRLALEVARYRKVMTEADGHFQTIYKAWNAHGGGHLVALFLLKKIMFRERFRLPLDPGAGRSPGLDAINHASCSEIQDE